MFGVCLDITRILLRIIFSYGSGNYFIIGVRSAVILTFITGLIISISAYDMGEAYRDNVKEVRNKLPLDIKIWGLGQHGFQYYLEKEGAVTLAEEENKWKSGDYVVSTFNANPTGMPPELEEYLHQIDSIYLRSRLPIHLKSFKTNAGFFSQGFGILPLTFSRQPIDTMFTLVIKEDKERLTNRKYDEKSNLK